MKAPPKPAVVIVGFGRLGGALALALQRAGWPVSVRPRSAASKARAKKAKLPTAGPDELRDARLCILAVPDDAVAKVARELHSQLGAGTSLIHCSGALTLDAFMVPVKSRGSFHPLVAVSDPNDPLDDGCVAIAARDPKLAVVLKRLADAVKLYAFEVPEARRAAYHAGAVMSAGLVVALIDAAAEATGLPREVIEPALLHLTATALRGAKERGLAAAITGPVVRGDAGVVAAHLVTLPGDLGTLYRALSRRSLALAKLDADTRSRLAAVLSR